MDWKLKKHKETGSKWEVIGNKSSFTNILIKFKNKKGGL